jgi:hypothetical protein
MDDKSLNLWRQIESCRRRARKRALPAGALAEASNSRAKGA